MKKYLFLITIILLAASCSKNPVANDPVSMALTAPIDERISLPINKPALVDSGVHKYGVLATTSVTANGASVEARIVKLDITPQEVIYVHLVCLKREMESGDIVGVFYDYLFPFRDPDNTGSQSSLWQKYDTIFCTLTGPAPIHTKEIYATWVVSVE